MNPLLLVDSYKIHHTKMYPDHMTKLVSNFTPRKSRLKRVDKVVVFGIQNFILEYLIKAFDKEFFSVEKEKMIEEYKRHCPVDTAHIEELWDLGYLPIKIKALPEGSLCPIGIPLLTITNTHERFGWLVNYLETLLSCMLWQSITSATISYEYKKLLEKYAKETTGSTEGVQWQGHDFSMRGMSSPESAILSGMGHLLSFTGTDTIPAIYQLEKSYNAVGLIGASVPATEHSVMCMGTKESEIDTFRRLLDLYPTAILSVVSDTWNLWDVIKPGGYCAQLKKEILAREGKLVIRPDSGDPVDIICGLNTYYSANGTGQLITNYPTEYPQDKGVIELLWDEFGGTINEQGYKVLDSHVGAIYGDSITLDRAEQICERLKAKSFASTNIVLGIGSYTYQYNTRDTFGFAMKATYGEVRTVGAHGLSNPVGREIWKDPITDDGTKKSAKGLLCVKEVFEMNPSNNKKIHKTYELIDRVSKEEEETGALEVIFEDSKLIKTQTLSEIRERLSSHKVDNLQFA